MARENTRARARALRVLASGQRSPPGKCAEAFRFDQKHLGDKIAMTMTHGESPAPNPNVPADWNSAVLHARTDIGGTSLLEADIANAEPMKSAYLSLMIVTVEEAERVYTVLLEGGQMFMPMAETSFAVRFAMLRDKYGASWMLLKARPQA